MRKLPVSCRCAAVAAAFLGLSSASIAQAPAGELQPAVAEELVTALASLRSHVENKAPLDDAGVEVRKATVDRHAAALGESQKAIRAAFELVAAYDQAQGPLWVSGRSFDRGKGGKTPPPNDIHWTVFGVMQHLLDRAYTSENVARYASLFDGRAFGSSANFPGAVKPPVDPAAVYSVPVNASYLKAFKHPILGDEVLARRPTGAYVVAGSITTVTVPPALVGKGYQLRVGAHSWDMSKKPRALRLDRVSITFPVEGTDVRIAHPLGGAIYLEVPLNASAGIVELKIHNTVRSPFFSSLPYRRTSLEEWRKTERNHKAPWADFQSEKFLMQVPTSWITALDDPITLMADWDKAMDATTDLMGLPNLWGREVAYLQVDLQNRGSAFFPGYPTCNDRYDPTKDYGGYANNYLVRGPRTAGSHVFHEMGHGFLFTKYVGDTEAVVNLLHVAVMNRAFGVDLEESFRSSRGSANPFCTLDTTAVEWMMNLNFVEGKGMSPAERQYQLKGHAKFVEIARICGWEALSRFWGSIVKEEEQGVVRERNIQDSDWYTQRLSESAGVDLRPLIEFWGIPTKDAAASDAAVRAAGLAASAQVYDRLVAYKTLVPADRETFRAFALQWWGKPPSAEGYTTERNHAARWESYDAAEAERVRQRVQAIIDRYFPAGRP